MDAVSARELASTLGRIICKYPRGFQKVAAKQAAK